MRLVRLVLRMMPAVLCVGTATAEVPETLDAKEMLVDVRMIWNAGEHNAFTDLVRFKDRWFCAFREASGHSSNDGVIRVIVSPDGERWESAALIETPDPARPDMRDAKLAVTPDGKLMLIAAGRDVKTYNYLTYTCFSDDGKTWSKPMPVGDDRVWLWRITWHEGICYSLAYGVNGTWLRLYASREGRDFRTLVEKLSPSPAGSRPGEPVLAFEGDTAIALVRQEGKEPSSLVGVSRRPYTEWTWKDLGFHLGGPHLIRLSDGRYVAGGRKYITDERGKVTRYSTVLLWLDPGKGKLTEFLELPSGGDTSYPGFVEHAGLLWVSYYSSHERHKARIYLAKVKLPPVD
ncbi:MAG TPA: sialidase family protein [Planctomycetota bacterium]|nr:sialidase family protein [Planctomycetota bacterium]